LYITEYEGIYTMNKTTAYLRVSTDGQDLNNQKLEILDYAQKHSYTIDNWIEVKVSSRKSTKERLVDHLINQLESGDCLIVSELSRLGRSVGQIINIIDQMITKRIKVVIIKEAMVINGTNDIATKTMITMFSLFAEVERDLISIRTKTGLMRAKAEGKLIGRPKGRGKSKLDGKEDEIKELLGKQVSRASISKIMNVSWPTLNHFIKTRNLMI